jgi:aminopeptidase N
MAHLWFGDLVTMAWWDNTWLNEGFASWMALKVTDHFNPSWNVWERENESKNYAMESDARKTTHPIQLAVTRASEALNTFDEISYEKGAAVLRMLETYLGEDAFRQGIRDYLVAHQYSNTTSADLWEALGKASGKAVSDLAPGWIEQPGFPLVQVKSSCQNQTRTITVEQVRFSVNDPNPKPLLWQIPVTLARIESSQKVSTHLLATQSMTMPGGNCTTPVKLNAENVGYYRVQYEPAMFAELRDIAESKLSVADRLSLLSDTWALVEAERLSSVDYLNLVQALREDNHLAIWEEVLGTLGFIDQLQIGQSGREAFQAYARSLLNPVFERVGWDSKPGEEKSVGLLRSRLISSLGDFKEERIIADAQRRFGESLKNPASLPPDLRPPVVGIVGRYSDRVTYDQLHSLGRRTQSTEEKKLYYGAMARALDLKLAQETLQIALTDELPPTLNFALFSGVASGGEHRELAWEVVQQHWKPLAERMSNWDQAVFVPGILETFSDSSRAEELEVYAKTNLPDESKQEVAKAAEAIRFKAKLKQRELPNIDQCVQSQAQSR